ncbi:hypothetical protein EDB83DRAFT_1576383 [Lactarius deliciosus]|nr:hypothetical protein EDB83DRAFT_1576383 [Lactarius deliciosus]
MYHDDDEDDDPYAPRTGPAAMPSPRLKYAPYYSGCTDTLEDFLEEFEGLAYDCELTDPQRVDVLIRYVAPLLRDFWRSLNGYRSHDWPLFRQSLIKVFGSTTPRPQVMRQRLLSYVQDSSRTRMNCADDVIRYYRQFLCLGEPLVHSGHLTKEDRNAAFWYGFHPEDREVLWPRLLGKNPFQPSDVPFHFEDVFVCARGAFAYGNPFPPWLYEQQFQSPSVRREQLVIEPILRDAYSFRAVMCAITSNAETTGNLDELPSPPQSTPQPQFPSSSPSTSEPQQTQAPSVTLDQPEPAHTFSSTLLPSASPLSHTPSLVYLASDSDPIPASTPPSFSLTPSAFPTPTHTDSLAHSDAEISSILPLSSIMPTSTMPSVSSGFQCLPSATEDQSEPEPAPALFASVPTLPSTPSHVHLAINNVASTPPSASPTSSTCLPSVTEEQPEPEPEPIPLIAPASTFASTPLPSSSSTFLPTPVISATDCQPTSKPASASPVSKFDLTLRVLPLSPDQKLDLLPRALSPPPGCLLVLPISSPTLSSLPLPEISTLDSTLTALSLDQSSSLLGSLSQSSGPCELESSTPASAADVVTLSRPELSESSQDEFISSLPASLEAPPITPISPHLTLSQRPPGLETFDSDSSPPEIAPVPANLAPSPSTFVLLPVFPASSDLPSASPSSSFVFGPGLESSTVNIAPRSSLESSLSSLCEPILYLPASLETSTATPTSTTSQRPPRPTTSGLIAPALEVTPVFALSARIYEVSSTLVPRFPLASSPRSNPRLAHFNFALSLVTVAVLVSAFFNVSAARLTHTRKFRSKQDIDNSRIDTLKASSCNAFAHQLQLGQLTPRASRFVFDPGGPASSSSFQVSNYSAHEGARKRMPKTRNDFITRRHPYSRSNRQPRFRPQRWSIRVRASRRGLGNV